MSAVVEEPTALTYAVLRTRAGLDASSPQPSMRLMELNFFWYSRMVTYAWHSLKLHQNQRRSGCLSSHIFPAGVDRIEITRDGGNKTSLKQQAEDVHIHQCVFTCIACFIHACMTLIYPQLALTKFLYIKHSILL